MTTQIRSIGDLIAVRRATANVAATAGGSGDGSEEAGVIIDRAALGHPQSAVIAIPFTATLAADKTLGVSWKLETGADSGLSDAKELSSAATAVVATGPAGGGTLTGTIEANVPLMGAGRYVRLKFTPDLSALTVDTAELSAVFAFGGADRLPQ